jgi:hypothetical protein
MLGNSIEVPMQVLRGQMCQLHQQVVQQHTPLAMANGYAPMVLITLLEYGKA